MTSGTYASGWLVVVLTMVALLIVEPRIPGLSHTGVWGGLASAFGLTLWSVLPPPRAFRRVWLLPVLIAGQALCWTLVWQNTTDEHYWWGLFPCWLVSAIFMWLMHRFVVVPSE